VDLAVMTKQPLDVELAGKAWRLKPRTYSELGELQAWFKRSVRSPLVRTMESLEQARSLGVAIEAPVRELMVRVATEKLATWPPRVGSVAWLEAVEEAGLEPHVVHFALSALHPELTVDQAAELCREAAPGETGVIAFALFSGRLPDPKAGVTPTTTTTGESPPSGTTGEPSSSP
jgi:hypothetical protein